MSKPRFPSRLLLATHHARRDRWSIPEAITAAQGQIEVPSHLRGLENHDLIADTDGTRSRLQQHRLRHEVELSVLDQAFVARARVQGAV
jgi:hypothetical protein